MASVVHWLRSVDLIYNSEIDFCCMPLFTEYFNQNREFTGSVDLEAVSSLDRPLGLGVFCDSFLY